MTATLESTNPTRQILGEILISQDWVKPTDLDAALTEQRESNERLGQILVRLGHLSEMELEFILAQQKGNTLTGEADNVKQRLGDILRKSSRLTPRELSLALDEQKRTNEQLGTVLTRLGLLSQDELNACLAWQDDFNAGDPLAVRLLIGEILVASKRVSRRELADALEQQRLTKKQVGQILLESGKVSKFDLRNALKIQTKMVAATLVGIMGAAMMTGCATPTVPTTLGPKSQMQNGIYRPAFKGTQAFNPQGRALMATLPGGKQIQRFKDGSNVLKDVPFFQQGHDNTCGQASTTVVLNYWGVNQDYQELVNEQNKLNLGTGYDKIVDVLKAKGLDAKAYRQGNLAYLKRLIDDGRPPIVMLEYNHDMLQSHYVVVVGYNELSNKIIIHDSIDGPYRQFDADEFTAMWQAPGLSSLPVLGGGNYQGLIIEAGK